MWKSSPTDNTLLSKPQVTRPVQWRVGAWIIAVGVLFFGLGYESGRRNWDLSFLGIGQGIAVPSPSPATRSPLAPGANAPVDLEKDIDFDLFWRVWQRIGEHYIDQSAVDQRKMYYGAISGMVQSLGDPYTIFLPPEQNKGFKEQLGGSFEGVGIQLGFRDEQLVVIAPLKGTPAEKAGVRAQDAIIQINDKHTTNMSLPEAVSLIRGSKGTKVKLTIFRSDEKEPVQVELVRDTITVKSVEAQFLENDLAWIKLSRFGEETNGEWDRTVDEIISRKSKGVILDVRNNPGGILEVAVHISSDFLTDGIVLQKEGVGGKRDPIKVIKKARLANLPTVVLINKGSASASEIVAGALQDRGRAKLVGEQSFGKGSVQDSQDLDEGAGLHITIAKWLLPSGRWINSSGLTPDVKLEITQEEIKEGKDPQLEQAKGMF